MTDLAVRDDQPARQIERMSTEQLRFIGGTDFVPKAIRGNVPAIMACVATGRALGISDMHALRSVHVIDGKASISAELMVALARRAGHSITGDVGAESCTVRGRRGDNGDEMTATFTLEMAGKAGLLNKANWKGYPGSMMWARAVSQLCRMLFPDVLAGVSYTPEEAEMSPEERVAEVLTTQVPVDDGPEDEHGGSAPADPTPRTDETPPLKDAQGEGAGEIDGEAVEEHDEGEQTAFPIPESARGHDDRG